MLVMIATKQETIGPTNNNSQPVPVSEGKRVRRQEERESEGKGRESAKDRWSKGWTRRSTCEGGTVSTSTSEGSTFHHFHDDCSCDHSSLVSYLIRI